MKYFGTDGIRGAVPGSFLTPGFARRVGVALGQYIRTRYPGRSLHAVVGRDTRASGTALADAVTEGLALEGVLTYCAGCLPTPAVAYSVSQLEARVGVVITASHNPHTDNGIKVFLEGGRKLTPEEEVAVECLIDNTPESGPVSMPPSDFDHDAIDAYTNFALSTLHQHSFKGWALVIDTAHGATTLTSPRVLRHLGAEVIHLGGEPNGHNINEGVGSEFASRLGEIVRQNKACCGLAHDGDGDRLVVVDDQGELLDGDILLGLFALHLHKRGRLRHGACVVTVQSNSGLVHTLQKAGIKVHLVPVGDRNVAQKLRSDDLSFGGESSGHIIFADIFPTGDGLMSALQLLQMLQQSNARLSELRKRITLFPQVTRTLTVAAKPSLDSLTGYPARIAEIEASLGDSGRLLVRYSGTEPKIRLLAEAETQALAEAAADEVESLLRTILPVID